MILVSIWIGKLFSHFAVSIFKSTGKTKNMPYLLISIEEITYSNINWLKIDY